MDAKRLGRFLVMLAALLAGGLLMGSCGNRDGMLEGTVTGVDPSTIQVQVVVYELQRADDVQGVNVFQKGVIVQKALVDESGRFAFTLPAEEYVLQVWLNGREAVDRLVEVKSGRTTTLDLEVTPPPS